MQAQACVMNALRMIAKHWQNIEHAPDSPETGSLTGQESQEAGQENGSPGMRRARTAAGVGAGGVWRPRDTSQSCHGAGRPWHRQGRFPSFLARKERGRGRRRPLGQPGEAAAADPAAAEIKRHCRKLVIVFASYWRALFLFGNQAHRRYAQNKIDSDSSQAGTFKSQPQVTNPNIPP